uniref:Nodulin-21 n=1 Tax=Cajanus cajan TaxID=3821 RepID=A0A151S226_CAJCA|nr:Nodulin-21 [Cajanus cajan]
MAGIEVTTITTCFVKVVGTIKQDNKVMMQWGLMGLVSWVCCRTTTEFASVSIDLDMEGHSRKREEGDSNKKKASLPNILKEIAISCLAICVGATVLLLVASLTREYKVGLGTIVTAMSFSLFGFGWLCNVGQGSSVEVLSQWNMTRCK